MAIVDVYIVEAKPENLIGDRAPTAAIHWTRSFENKVLR
jgi:hypothetical protein